MNTKLKLMCIRSKFSAMSQIHFLTLLLSSFVVFETSAQSATRDTLELQNGKIEVSFIVTTNLTLFDSLEIVQSQIDGGDTLVVYTGFYSIEEDDASDFKSWSVDDQAGTITFQSGQFEPTEVRAVLRVYKSSGIPEEYTFN